MKNKYRFDRLIFAVAAFFLLSFLALHLLALSRMLIRFADSPLRVNVTTGSIHVEKISRKEGEWIVMATPEGRLRFGCGLPGWRTYQGCLKSSAEIEGKTSTVEWIDVPAGVLSEQQKRPVKVIVDGLGEIYGKGSAEDIYRGDIVIKVESLGISVLVVFAILLAIWKILSLRPKQGE